MFEPPKKRPEQTPQGPQHQPHKSYGFPFAPQSYAATIGPKIEPPALPKYSQLNLFEFHGIDPNTFRTPLTFSGGRGYGQNPAPSQGQGPESPWQERLKRREQERQAREEQFKYNQLDWLTPSPEALTPARPAIVPEPKRALIEKQMTAPKAGTLGSDLSGLRSISDYLAMHPNDPLPRGANLDELSAKAEAYQAKQTGENTSGVQVASDHVLGRGSGSETPVEQFQDRLQAGAIARLQKNKARLTQVQGTYENTQPSNEQWKTLRTLSNRDQQLKRLQDQTNQELVTLFVKKEFSNTPLGRLANQTPLGKMLDLPKSDPIHNEFLLNVLGTSPQDIDPKYKEQFTGLRDRLELLYSVRQEMRAVHPALAVVDTYVVSTMANIEWNNSVIYREMGKGFDGMRQDMTRLSKTIEQDPSKALLFDTLETQTLNTFKDPAERQQAKVWAQQQKDKDASLKAALGLGTFGLTVGGALAGPLGWGANVARGLLFGGSVLGTALAAHEFPQLQVVDLAARAGAAGGEKLTNQSPEEARMNLAMGYANLAIAGLDVGLSAGAIARVTRIPGAVKSAASLTRRQSQVLVNSIARHSGTLTDAALEKLLTAVRTADEKTTQIILNGDGTLTKMSPLEGVTQKLETTVAARASGKVNKPKDMLPAERLALAQKNYGQSKNWEVIKPLIGTAVTKTTKLPPGYVFYEKPGRNKTLFILRENADDASFAPLMIEGGKLQVGKARLSRGLDVMKANLKAVGVDTPKGFQLNHLVPDAVAQSDPMVIEMLKRGIYDVDHAGNLLPMPGEVRGSHPDLIGHYGSHGNYNDLVKQRLTDETNILIERHGSLSKVSDSELKEAVKDIENEMREGITKRNPEIPTRYDPEMKTRVLSEGLSDPDFVA